MKTLYFSLLLMGSICAFAQPLQPAAVSSNNPVNWGYQLKSGADTCGTYFNNYIGLGKTSSLRIERMRTGNVADDTEYNGRAQKYSAPQPIEISGIEFYSFIDNNPIVDSLMVITTLNEYDGLGNTLGLELARDTVYVKHTSFDPVFDPVPSISVQSEFDSPITVNSDYMVAIYTPTDDSLRILCNEPTLNDGSGEGLGYALYDNSNYPSFIGWYDMLIDYTADYDFLISPKIAFEKPTSFILSDSSFCPNSQTCVIYNQMPIQGLKQYNSSFAAVQGNIGINWNDGSMTSDTTTACHTYTNTGLFAIEVFDTINIWNFVDPTCKIELSKNITVTDSIDVTFTFTQSGLNVDFTSTTMGVDSLWWDFGDNSTGTDDLNPSHTYPGPGTYNVWLYAFNDCMTKALFKTITIQSNGIGEEAKRKFSIYPNPASEKITLSGISDKSLISIYNIAGELVYSNKNMSEKSSINVSELTNGTYFVKMQTGDNMMTKKITINH
ncbi:MAG: T9SS type A sorting domain-containing protein [Crocinitomicaceae bacterium]